MIENKLKLTQTVQKGGCAAKVAASELRKILSLVQFPPKAKEVSVDGSSFDDAAIVLVNEQLALVQTLDFFTPIVDSPFLFGQIAAANSLSDVYAMGGRPKTAMAILAFPLMSFSNEVVAEVLQGASDKMREASCSFVGGHSIDDETLKFGLSVTGYVHPQQVWSNAGAKVGDHLILTKPLGTGSLTAGLKRGVYSEEQIQEALTSMSQLNNAVDFLSENEARAVHAATDITGFGFAGHAKQMAQASGVSMQIYFSSLPRFSLLQDSLQQGFLTKAHRTNREYTEKQLSLSGLTHQDELVLFDPQTSGGLLLSVDPQHSETVLNKLSKAFLSVCRVGEVTEPQGEKCLRVQA